MEKNLFATTTLDTDFLQSVYDNDRETALFIFQQYLQDLPADLTSIRETFDTGVKEEFRQLIHKKKVVFSYVGLTGITARLDELEKRCAQTADLSTFAPEVKSILESINSSTEAVESIFKRLQQD
jgi:hypothetical protein